MDGFSIGTAVAIPIAAVLVASAAMKLVAPRATHAALATFGVGGERARWGLWTALVGSELAIAAGAVARIEAAAYAGALLMTAFAVALERGVARGRAGQPCGCFGRRSRVGRRAVARNFTLAVGLAALPPLWRVEPTAQGWLAVGLAVALVAVAGLAVTLLALAREVGALRLALPPQSALEIVDEGPELGGRTELASRFELDGETLALAVFTSATCSVPLARARPVVPRARPVPRAPCLRRGSRRRRLGRARGAGQPVRGGAGARRHGPRQGVVQQPGPARERPRHGGAARARRADRRCLTAGR